MIDSTPGAKRFKGLLPARTIVAHKSGTSGTQNGITAATNDIGIVTLPNGNHVAIAVFVSDSPEGEATVPRNADLYAFRQNSGRTDFHSVPISTAAIYCRFLISMNARSTEPCGLSLSSGYRINH
jgi:hypothetical protein